MKQKERYSSLHIIERYITTNDDHLSLIVLLVDPLAIGQ